MIHHLQTSAGMRRHPSNFSTVSTVCSRYAHTDDDDDDNNIDPPREKKQANNNPFFIMTLGSERMKYQIPLHLFVIHGLTSFDSAILY